MCDSLVAVGPKAADGITVFAKNSDRKAEECQPFVQHVGALHPPGSSVRCTHIEIPQVAETYRVMGHSPWWVWGFEHGVNEHAVAIGNETVFSKEPVEELPGLIGMDLVRLGLERGRSAREALEVIATALETYGQGGAALSPDGSGYHNGFLLADPDEAWILQTSGRRWAARRTQLDAVSNHLSLGSDWEIGSRDLDVFARDAGWWRSGARVDVSAAYRNPGVPGRISEGRLRRSQELLTRTSGRTDVGVMQDILRDHFEGGVVRLPGSTTEDERYFTLCMHSEPIGTTTASLVARLVKDRTAPWPVWISFATPCTGVFLPVYLEATIPDALACGGETSSDDSMWWTLKRLQDAASVDFPRYTPQIREGFAPIEAAIAAERPEIERRAARAIAGGDEDEAGQVLAEFMARTTAEAMKLANLMRERIEG